MQKFQSLTKYIFLIPEDDIVNWVIDCENDGFKGCQIQMPLVNYSEMIDRFIEDVYKFNDEYPEFELNRYGEILEKNDIKWETNL